MKSAVVPGRLTLPRWLWCCAKLAVPLLIALSWSQDASAYAWMIKHGYAKCNSCHTDPSGGETLTHMGRVMGDTLMSTQWDDTGLSDNAKLLYGLDEPDWLRIGGSLRGMSVIRFGEGDSRVFPMQADVYATGEAGVFRFGGSIGAHSIRSDSPHGRKAQVTTGDDGVNLISRWHWIGIAPTEDSLLRVGRMNLPFGLRLPDHVLFVRESTLTDRESDQQHGVAFAMSRGKWRGEMMFVLGNYQMGPDDYRERGYVGFAEFMPSNSFAIGASSMILQSAKSIVTGAQTKTIRHAHGLMARIVPWSPLVIMAEADVLKTSGRAIGYTGLLMADYEPLQGLHVRLTVEGRDEGKPETGLATKGLGELQTGVWATVQWFFHTHLDAQVDFVTRSGVDSTLQAQLHFYF